MAEIRPFRGIHYNPIQVKDFSAVICPPYDVISPQFQQDLHKRSDYNFVRLEYGLDMAGDNASNNKYTRAVSILDAWLKQDILMRDSAPAIYLHDQYFMHGGREYKRRGLTVCVRLEEWDKKVVLPHEGTMTGPKEDRIKLLWALQANTSPVFSLFEDRDRQVQSLVTVQAQKPPTFSSKRIDGERHDVWTIAESWVINAIAKILTDRPLYIADGHHRYESALIYQREKRATAARSTGDEPYNFVMMTLVDFADPGLIIMPPHRLARGISPTTLKDLTPKLKAVFDIEEIPMDAWSRVDTLLADPAAVRLAMYGLAGDRISVLTLRDTSAANRMIPLFHSDVYKKLDVSIIDHIILENFLTLASGEKNIYLDYDYDRQNTVRRVQAGEFQLSFLLKPVKPELIKSIADIGDKLPRKSTYFYPKLPAGLIFNRLT